MVMCFVVYRNSFFSMAGDQPLNEAIAPMLDYEFLIDADISIVNGDVVITRDEVEQPYGRSMETKVIRKTENGRDYILLTKVSGGIVPLDTIVYATDQKVVYGCVGHTVGIGQKVTQSPTGSSWSYTTPSSWEYVYDNSDLSIVGVNYEVTLHHRNSTWNHSILNNILGPV